MVCSMLIDIGYMDFDSGGSDSPEGIGQGQGGMGIGTGIEDDGVSAGIVQLIEPVKERPLMVRLEIGQTKLVIIALVQLLQASVHRHRAVDAGLTLADPSKVRPVNDLYPHSLFRGYSYCLLTFAKIN